MKKLLLGIMISALPAFCFGQYKLYPRNEAYKDSSLTDFICKLQYAVFKKDKSFLISVLDSQILNSFGGDGGVEEFKEMWQLDSTDSDVWFVMSKLISMGGTFLTELKDSVPESRFAFPYVFSLELPSDRLDIFITLVVTGTNVNVREKPDRNARILGKLSYDIVINDYDKSYPPDSYADTNRNFSYLDKEWYYCSYPLFQTMLN